MKLFWRVYKKTGLKKNEDLSEEVLHELQQKGEDIMHQVIQEQKEKDVMYSADAMEETAYIELDLNDPEDLAIITKEQTEDMEGTMRKYGIPAEGPRRKQYDAAMRRLRDDKDFYALYLDAYNRRYGG